MEYIVSLSSHWDTHTQHASWDHMKRGRRQWEPIDLLGVERLTFAALRLDRPLCLLTGEH